MKMIIVKNDKIYDYDFVITESDKVTPIDVTDAVVKFRAQLVSSKVLKVEQTLQIINAAAGKVKYTIQEGDFDQAGEYIAELEITYESGKVITIPLIELTVYEKVPNF